LISHWTRGKPKLNYRSPYNDQRRPNRRNVKRATVITAATVLLVNAVLVLAAAANR
jgi:hypothetical protein